MTDTNQRSRITIHLDDLRTILGLAGQSQKTFSPELRYTDTQAMLVLEGLLEFLRQHDIRPQFDFSEEFFKKLPKVKEDF